MKNTIPGPILNRIIKLIICGICITGAGVVWSVASRDKTTAMLSLAVALICVMKVATLYRTARDAAYDVFEGTVLTATVLPLRKKQEVILQQDDGQISIMLEGRTKFDLGSNYRIYTEKQHEVLRSTNLPQAFLPGRSLLGFELLDKNGSQKMM